MTTKKITRTFELTVEKNERLIIQSHQIVSGWCSICRSLERFAIPESAARRFDMNQRDIFSLIETAVIGFAELPGGSLSVCLECLNSALDRR